MKYLTTKQLAERWNMHPGALQMQRQRGTGIAYVRLGRAIRYPLEAVLEAERDGYINPNPQKETSAS